MARRAGSRPGGDGRVLHRGVERPALAHVPTDVLAALGAARSKHATAYGQALADVARAAARLGSPGPHVAGAAAATAAVQQAGAGPVAAPRRAARRRARRLPRAARSAHPARRAARTRSTSVTCSPRRARSTRCAARPRGPVRRVDPRRARRARDRGGTAPSGTTPAPASGTTADATAGSAETATATETAADAAVEEEPARSIEELLAELDALTGLTRVKDEIHRQTELLRVEKLRTEAGLTRPTLTRHLVFLGNPGTGKTTVARLVAGIYRALGLLEKGHLVEVDRSSSSRATSGRRP